MMTQDQDGFTLVEVIVSLAIASLALVAFYGSLADGLGQQKRINQREATALQAVYISRLLSLGKDPTHIDQKIRSKKVVWEKQVTLARSQNSSRRLQSKHVLLSAHEPSGRIIFILETLVPSH